MMQFATNIWGELEKLLQRESYQPSSMTDSSKLLGVTVGDYLFIFNKEGASIDGGYLSLCSVLSSCV